MAEVELTIGDRYHNVACRDGEEPQLRKLGDMLNQRWPAAARAAGNAGAERAMLFVALMLADALDEAQSRPPEGSAVGEAALEELANRLEHVAAALERADPRA